MHNKTIDSQLFPVKYIAIESAAKMIIPCLASKPLNPAKKLNVVEAPIIPKGIIIKNYSEIDR